MTAKSKVFADDEKLRRLQHELDHKIRVINQETIGAITGQVTMAQYTALARAVSRLRASYLKAALELGKASEEGETIGRQTAQLKALREAYQEAMQGFDALEHALRRGYINLKGY